MGKGENTGIHFFHNYLPNDKNFGHNQFESICRQQFNPLPNGKILDYFKLKACVDNEIHVTQQSNFVME